jgi:hypothetical protein
MVTTTAVGLPAKRSKYDDFRAYAASPGIPVKAITRAVEMALDRKDSVREQLDLLDDLTDLLDLAVR